VILSIMLALSLVGAIEQVESGGDVNAIGDNGKALGCLQIWEVCFNDVKHYPEMKGYVYKDVVKRDVAYLVFKLYMKRYATEKRLGRKVTDQDRARIWNGGPNGYKKSGTLNYWKKVKEEINGS